MGGDAGPVNDLAAELVHAAPTNMLPHMGFRIAHFADPAKRAGPLKAHQAVAGGPAAGPTAQQFRRQPVGIEYFPGIKRADIYRHRRMVQNQR